MRRVEEGERAALLSFLRQDVGNCVYMYLDIAQYGIDHPELDVYLSGDKAPGEDPDAFVAMRYYKSYQLYARAGAVPEEGEIALLTALLEQSGAGMISGPRHLTDLIAEGLSATYDYVTGYVFRFNAYRKFDDLDVTIEKGLPEDLPEAARMICADDGIGGHYEADNLTRQLQERQKSGMGRNLVIRKKGGGLTGHIATYAEHDGIAVTGGLIAEADGTGIPYGTMLESRLINDLLSEGLQVFTFVTEARRKRFLKGVGGEQIGEYGKLTLHK